MSGTMNRGDDRPEEDVFKILIATDCHLGYEEKSNRGEDSFTTFEEILKYGKLHSVDFILLGGDLFHDNKPSQATVMKCMNLLRKYCLGTKPNKFQFLSDPKMIFKHCLNKTVNFEDANLNVEIPVFSIHGNHDDPSGPGQIGSLDLLSVTGLVNYFGKWTNLNEVQLAPLLFRKGCTNLALYGLSYIKDQRLSRLMRDGKVHTLRTNEIDDCFNIFVLHQNRAKHAENAFVPEEDLPNFFDFVLWGHEHECRIETEQVGKKHYHICQPGSPVATSLCQGEAVPKHIGILKVYKTGFQLQKHKLKTVRPFVFDTINVDDNNDIKIQPLEKLCNTIEYYVDNYIENVMMQTAAAQLSRDPRQPTLPLLRLRVFYTEEEQKFDTFRLEQKYVDQVANSGEIIRLRKKKSGWAKKVDFDDCDDDTDAIMEEALGCDEDEPEWNKTVQGGIRKYFAAGNKKHKLTVLSLTGLNEALSQFVDKGDSNAFDDIIEHQMKKTLEYISSKELETREEIADVIQEFQNERDNTNENEENQVRDFLNSSTRRVRQPAANLDVDDTAEDDCATKSNEDNAVRGRGRGRRARGRVGAASGRGRAKAPASISASKTVLIDSPTKSTRATKTKLTESAMQPAKQTSIAAHFPKSQKALSKPIYISDSDSNSD
ncbi:double-strand break repair protein MRE11 isoform X1 [Neodiprion virginianus]|uniref:double-strand break repair protein MRE11 isoform X1 n=1 Tax=Neodiprion virginianus TaxID=2961670 RepID=UPI001EE69478|nr:double-strand break repair protein MRE11 isoform X1 [Neodiprion virginianus]